MIDLNMKPKQKREEIQPEEIAMGVVAVILWVVIVLGWMGAC